MAENSPAKGLGLSERSVAVALITIGRYLADQDPSFVSFLQGSLEHAQASNLLDADLATLRLLVSSL